MLIDFTEDELDLIFDCLDERRNCSDNDDELMVIDTIYDKVWKESKNDNS
jgi:hypothetical protein